MGEQGRARCVYASQRNNDAADQNKTDKQCDRCVTPYVTWYMGPFEPRFPIGKSDDDGMRSAMVQKKGEGGYRSFWSMMLTLRQRRCGSGDRWLWEPTKCITRRYLMRSRRKMAVSPRRASWDSCPEAPDTDARVPPPPPRLRRRLRHPTPRSCPRWS